MPPEQPSPPKSLCLLRLSAIGDVTHVLPTVRTIQQAWPSTQITWVIGKTEHALVGDIPGIEFVVFNKSDGFKGFKALRKRFAGRRFDVLFHMQVSLRANFLSLCIPAKRRIGYDKARAKDLHHWFCNEQIAAVPNQHVLDSFLEFPKKLGVTQPVIRWDIPVPDGAKQWVTNQLGDKPFVAINPSSSQRLMNYRSGRASTYARVIAYVLQNLGWQVVLTGGPAGYEADLAEAILADECLKPHLNDNLIHNWVGKTNLKQMAATLQLANAVIAPDTGPIHMANALGTTAIGLYATSNPGRTGPYGALATTVNKYPDALAQFENTSPDQVKWGKRVRAPEAMDLITAEDIIQKLAQLAAK